MSFTNLTLGTNWELGEWPEHVTVAHQGDIYTEKIYHPERTGFNLSNKDKGYVDEDFVCSECLSKVDTHLIGWLGCSLPHFSFCPFCGVKIVSPKTADQLSYVIYRSLTYVVEKTMKRKGIFEDTLNERLGVDDYRLLLNENMSLETVAKFELALGFEFRVRVHQRPQIQEDGYTTQYLCQKG